MSRLPGRLITLAGVARHVLQPNASDWPEQPRRILIAHRLLLGDTLMLTPLLKKLRALYPQVEIVMTMARAFLPLYAARPYGVVPLAFEPQQAESVRAIIDSGPYDVAIVPGDNRHSWLARAAGARHIVAHADDVPAWKNWPVSHAVPYPSAPAAWADMVAELVPGPEPAPYRPQEWAAPVAAPFERPTSRYAVLHIGASYSLKQWPSERWTALAAELQSRGITPVWSAGRNEAALVQAADPAGRYRSTAGQLDLAQLWQLLAGAQLLVCPDTGIAHLARLVDVPTVTLFGPGSAAIVGAGRFWRDARYAALTEPDFPCRDQRILFRREIDWVRRCERRPPACTQARCMDALTTERVLALLEARGWLAPVSR